MTHHTRLVTQESHTPHQNRGEMHMQVTFVGNQVTTRVHTESQMRVQVIQKR